MKKLFTLGLFLLTINIAMAGEPLLKQNKKKNTEAINSFEKGKVLVSLGYGFPNLGKTIAKLYNSATGYKAGGFGPAHFKVEYGVYKNLGIGLSVNASNYFFTYKEDGYNAVDSVVTYNYKYNYTAIAFNFRLNYHFITNEKIDFYGGIGAGYGFRQAKWSTDNPSGTNNTLPNLIPVGLEGTLGLRYYFTPNIGIYTELGLAKSLIQGGLVFKF
jgi:hypothetical protein